MCLNKNNTLNGIGCFFFMYILIYILNVKDIFVLSVIFHAIFRNGIETFGAHQG
jgi:hypothetical protein